MKKLLIALGVSAAMMSSSVLADEIARGDLIVNGKVISETCQVNGPNGLNYTMTLADVTQSEINGNDTTVDKAVGEKWHTFNLTGCPAVYKSTSGKTYQKVSLVALGGKMYVESGQEGLLKNNYGTGVAFPDSADDVYIRLLKRPAGATSGKETLEIFNDEASADKSKGIIAELKAGQPKIALEIGAEYYRKAGEVATGGKIQGLATLMLSYQ